MSRILILTAMALAWPGPAAFSQNITTTLQMASGTCSSTFSEREGPYQQGVSYLQSTTKPNFKRVKLRIDTGSKLLNSLYYPIAVAVSAVARRRANRPKEALSTLDIIPTKAGTVFIRVRGEYSGEVDAEWRSDIAEALQKISPEFAEEYKNQVADEGSSRGSEIDVMVEGQIIAGDRDGILNGEPFAIEVKGEDFAKYMRTIQELALKETDSGLSGSESPVLHRDITLDFTEDASWVLRGDRHEVTSTLSPWSLDMTVTFGENFLESPNGEDYSDLSGDIGE